MQMWISATFPSVVYGYVILDDSLQVNISWNALGGFHKGLVLLFQQIQMLSQPCRSWCLRFRTFCFKLTKQYLFFFVCLNSRWSPGTHSTALRWSLTRLPTSSSSSTNSSLALWSLARYCMSFNFQSRWSLYPAELSSSQLLFPETSVIKGKVKNMPPLKFQMPS